MDNQDGRVTSPDTIELLYHCLTTEGEILAGWSRGTVVVISLDPPKMARPLLTDFCRCWPAASG